MFPRFLDLPLELQTHITTFLESRELLPLALSCKLTHGIVAPRLDDTIALDGTIEAQRFVRSYRRHTRSLFCSHGHPIKIAKTQEKQHQRREPSASKCRVERIKDLTLFDVRPVYSWQQAGDASSDDGSTSSDDHASTTSSRASSASQSSASPRQAFENVPGNLIGAALSIMPNLEALCILSCPIPLSTAFAYVISAWAPRLRRLTLRLPHVDAAALAMLLRNLKHLEELEVGSVKTCWCRGMEGRREGAKDLADALKYAKNLRRVSFNSSSVIAVDGGMLFRLLAQNPCDAEASTLDLSELGRVSRRCSGIETVPYAPLPPCNSRIQKQHCTRLQEPSSPSPPKKRKTFCPTSLELRRSPLHGRALVQFLTSQSAARLERLFVGGCKAVRQSHLAALAPSGRDATEESPCSFLASNASLCLELDARLLSTELLSCLSHRIVHLRVFHPTSEQIALMRSAFAKGLLSRCRNIVICPRIDGQDSADPKALTIGNMEQVRVQLEAAVANGAGMIGLNRDGPQSQCDVTVGDSAWWKMKRDKEELQRWAQADSFETQVSDGGSSTEGDAGNSFLFQGRDVDMSVTQSPSPSVSSPPSSFSAVPISRKRPRGDSSAQVA